MPWLQLAMFGLLSAGATAIGRLGFGVGHALSSRYVPLSNLFLEATLVIALTMLLLVMPRLKKINNNVLLLSSVVLLALFAVGTGASYVGGWHEGSLWSEKVLSDSSCLEYFEIASDECLLIMYRDPEIVRDRARILQEHCIGPYAGAGCKYGTIDERLVKYGPLNRLKQVYIDRPDLQYAFPEVSDRGDLLKLFCWAKDHGVYEDQRLAQHATFYKSQCP
jgi:hypothetical protein